MKKMRYREPEPTIEEEYFEWLWRSIQEPGSSIEKRELCRQLFREKFFWNIPNDDNRAEDGLELRRRFEHLKHLRRNILDDLGTCSMLEMLIGLSNRADNLLFDPNQPSKASIFFWEMVNNVGLKEVPEEGRYAIEKRNERILDIMLNRKYSRTGKGGLFPLKQPYQNQRDIEIWYQLMSYLDENYSVV